MRRWFYQLVHECVDILILGEFGSAFPSICDASSFLVLLSVHWIAMSHFILSSFALKTTCMPKVWTNTHVLKYWAELLLETFDATLFRLCCAIVIINKWKHYYNSSVQGIDQESSFPILQSIYILAWHSSFSGFN